MDTDLPGHGQEAVRTQQEDSHMQAKESGLQRTPCPDTSRGGTLLLVTQLSTGTPTYVLPGSLNLPPKQSSSMHHAHGLWLLCSSLPSPSQSPASSWPTCLRQSRWCHLNFTLELDCLNSADSFNSWRSYSNSSTDSEWSLRFILRLAARHQPLTLSSGRAHVRVCAHSLAPWLESTGTPFADGGPFLKLST